MRESSPDRAVEYLAELRSVGRFSCFYDLFCEFASRGIRHQKSEQPWLSDLGIR